MELKEHERIDALYSNQIQIIQSSQVFSFSLDAVLLSTFPKIPQKGKIADLCAGNGAVGLFVAPKTKAEIHQVELQPELFDMAKRSIALNHLEDQVTIFQGDVKKAATFLKKDSYDLVLCNPPYFKQAPEKKTNPNPYLALARHELTLTLKDVCQVASGLLKTKGKFALVHRPDRLSEILQTLNEAHLYPNKIQFVYPKIGKEANIVLIEAIKNGNPGGEKILPPITVYSEDNQYLSPVKEFLYGE